MSKELGWYEHSVFYRFRARLSVLLFGCSVSFLPIICLSYYASLFVYPLFLMTIGHPIADPYSCYCFLVILLYTLFWIWDIETPFRGGRVKMWFRKLAWWKWVAQYFPAKIVLTDDLKEWVREQGGEVCKTHDCVELPTDVNYLLGYHPHGPFAIGALLAFGSDSLRISEILPRIDVHMATLNLHYDIPFYRDYAMSGVSTSHTYVCEHVHGCVEVHSLLVIAAKMPKPRSQNKALLETRFPLIYRTRTAFAAICVFLCFAAQPPLAIYLYFQYFIRSLYHLLFNRAFEHDRLGVGFCLGIVYTLYWLVSINWPHRGGIDSVWFRELFLWRWAAEYFPAKLVVSDEMKQWARRHAQVVERANGEVSVYLPRNVNYLAGYHPHGTLSVGAMGVFGNDSLGFSRAFPGIRRHIATLNVQFKVPIYREYVMLGGGVSVSRESLEYLLDKDVSGKTGNMVAVSVGGAVEALESRPGQYVLMLSRRRGFFRMALKTGALVVPSIGFGETNMYDQVRNPAGSRLRRFQEWITHTITMAPPLFYSTRVIPYRKPLTVVIGRPIVCSRVPHPTDEEIDNLREEYKQQLTYLFNKYRPLYDPTAEDIRFF